MAKYSTGLRDMMHGKQAQVAAMIIGADLTLVDGGAGDDTITSTGSAFITQGFWPGDKLYLEGATTAANDSAITGTRIKKVEAGTLYLPTGTVDTGEAVPAGGALAVARGGSLYDIFSHGILRWYDGSVPTSPDNGAGTCNTLVEFTDASGSWAAGAFANGLLFETDPLSGVIEKAATDPNGDTHVWSGVAAASGIATWWGLYANASDAEGASTTLPRIYGTLGPSNADIILPNTEIESGRTYTIDEFYITMLEYYGASS